MDFKSFDWRSLKKYTSSQSANDFNAFLEKLPVLAGQSALIAAGIVWGFGAALGLFATVEAKQLTTLRAKYKETEALKPLVPVIRDLPVSIADIKNLADTMTLLYPGLQIRSQAGSITISAAATSSFSEFREAIGHAQSGGTGWRVTMDSLCVGRACDREKLYANLKISKVSVDKPDTGS